jgi:hypothetical protein
MNTRTSKVVVAVAAVAICAGGTVFGPPAQAQRIDAPGIVTNGFDDIGYVVAHRKEQSARDYVAYAAERAREAASQRVA